MSFYKLGINNDLVKALESQRITEPTPIQSLSIPSILEGKDLIGEAQTGTGKTFAFLLPMFQNINLEDKFIQGLIIAPTRELAIQITQVARKLAKTKPISILAAYGGQDVKAQMHKLKGTVHLVIGTPGRILDHIGRGTIDFSNVNTLVVDEADQMFHIGFMNEIDDILEHVSEDRQTLCFSATMSYRVSKFSKKYLTEPVYVKAPKKQITVEKIKQIAVETSNSRKFQDFVKILRDESPNKAIIFCRSRLGSNDVYEDLLEEGFNVATLHGGMTQARREKAMKDFKANKIKFLVATDVAARGLDVDGVTHVFNYNLPDESENYVHRIGRTGRAGKEGVAYTILTKRDAKRFKEIESFIKMKVERISVSEDHEAIAKKYRDEARKERQEYRGSHNKKSHDRNKSHSGDKRHSKNNKSSHSRHRDNDDYRKSNKKDGFKSKSKRNSDYEYRDNDGYKKSNKKDVFKSKSKRSSKYNDKNKKSNSNEERKKQGKGKGRGDKNNFFKNNNSGKNSFKSKSKKR